MGVEKKIGKKCWASRINLHENLVDIQARFYELLEWSGDLHLIYKLVLFKALKIGLRKKAKLAITLDKWLIVAYISTKCSERPGDSI